MRNLDSPDSAYSTEDMIALAEQGLELIDDMEKEGTI